jgi:hypothetical protein
MMSSGEALRGSLGGNRAVSQIRKWKDVGTKSVIDKIDSGLGMRWNREAEEIIVMQEWKKLKPCDPGSRWCL